MTPLGVDARALHSLEAARAKPKIRVVMVLPTYLPESFGGAEQQARKLAFALERRGVSVTMLVPRLLARTARSETDGPISIARIRVRHAPNLGGRHLVSFLGWCTKLAFWLARHRRSYDLVHVVHGRLHAVPAVLVARLLRKPSLVKIGRGGIAHFDLDILRAKRLFGKIYARMIVSGATGYIANSREIAADLARWHIVDTKVHRIANGVELPARATLETPSAPKCIYHGRLDPEKALDVMIRGFALLPRDAATLEIVGDGRCRAELERLIESLGVRDRVSVTGPVADVRPVLRASQIYVSTSVSEGMSNSLLEAMSYGLLPVVSRVSGVLDIVEHGHNGLLCTANDPEAFAACLREALALGESARREMGEQARLTVERRFGIDEIALRHRQLYERLIAARA
jgi:glycosyltransferase involved in cell wall biosynthesis